MAVTLWIDAENPRGATKVKQMAPAPTANIIVSLGQKDVPFRENTPMTPHFL